VLRFPVGHGGSSAAVTLDGAPAQVEPQGIEVDPGEHRIGVAAAGQRPFEQTFQISAGQSKEIVVDLQPDGAAPTTAPTPADAVPDRATNPWARPPLPVWILGGAGVAATAIGLTIRIKGKSDYDDATRDCRGGICTSSIAYDDGNAARDRMATGNILLGVGGAALAGAGVWGIVSATSRERASHERALSVGAHASADGCSVRLYGAF